MPIFTKDFTWSETESQVYILLPLKGTKPSDAAILSSNNYLRVTFTPFIFEIFLKNDVDDTKSIAKIIKGTVEFTLFKLGLGLWGTLSESNLDKATIFERRNAVEQELRIKEEAKLKDRADRRYKHREYAVKQQLKLENVDKDRIQKIKDKENEEVSNYLGTTKDQIEDSKENKCKKDLLKDQLKVEVEKRKSNDVSKDKKSDVLKCEKSEDVLKYEKSEDVLKYEKSEDASKREKSDDELKVDESNLDSKENLSKMKSQDLYKPNLPPIIFKKRKKKKVPKTDLPAPRQRVDIPVVFTPRVFPTAARESQAEEERLWLEKQAEARRMKSKPADVDIKPEECDPEWLKEKGDSFFKIGNYHAAINAYNEAIKQNNKLPYLYSNRAACHLKLGNLHKTIEDSSKALELLDPPVASNAKSRMKVFVRRGTAFCKLKLYKEGLMDYEAALKLDPENNDLKSDIEKIECLKKNRK